MTVDCRLITIYIVLDEAYRCTEQELSHWRGRKINEDKDTFNYFLSLNRQVVERAFGILVGRWGILGRPLRFATDKITLLLRVLCKLHNICINAFVQKSSSYSAASGDIHWLRSTTPTDSCMTVTYTDGTGQIVVEELELICIIVLSVQP
jgi:hypothetical protein